MPELYSMGTHLTVAEVAQQLRVTHKTVYRWINTGQLCATAQRPYLIRRQDLDTYLEKRRDPDKSLPPSLPPIPPVLVELDLAQLRDKTFRDLLCDRKLRWSIAKQIIDLRHARGWSQVKLAAKIGAHQATISVLECPSGRYPTLKTLIKIARVFDVGLVCRLVTTREFLAHIQLLESGSMYVPAFADDSGLQTWADEDPEDVSKGTFPNTYDEPRSAPMDIGKIVQLTHEPVPIWERLPVHQRPFPGEMAPELDYCRQFLQGKGLWEEYLAWRKKEQSNQLVITQQEP